MVLESVSRSAYVRALVAARELRELLKHLAPIEKVAAAKQIAAATRLIEAVEAL
ncbi:hypothetical protein DP62_5926 [Burkholderia pseudomallei]|uniref:hypothetical protein n=1 Tax=Burkholderia pseudomallei TaxID=28450 RepID=UPI00050DBED0|nr:hypothetical protein [Burkholderia pseudomallei]KGC96271.1 hypothetical protein DP62_5926 [Burkholderia pseudomallei]